MSEIKMCRKGLHEKTDANTYTFPSTGGKTCRLCRRDSRRTKRHYKKGNKFSPAIYIPRIPWLNLITYTSASDPVNIDITPHLVQAIDDYLDKVKFTRL